MGNNCQVPTPQKYANELLDCIGYTCMVHIMYTHLGMKNTFIQIKQMFIL